MDYETKNTEKRLVPQNDLGVSNEAISLLTEYNPIKIDCHNREEAAVLLFSLRSVCTFPMVFVHKFEYSPFRISCKFIRNSGAVEAFIQCWEMCFPRKFIDHSVSGQRCVCKPVTRHYSIVTESELIEPVNDYLCANRHNVEAFACNHKCIGIKLNIEDDGVSIILFPIQPTTVVMSKIVFDDNVISLLRFHIKPVVAKCHAHSDFDAIKSIHKKLRNHVANHASNHDEAFVLSAISIIYKGCFDSTNHVSNHVANHDRAKMTTFCAYLTTQVTTIPSLINCVISITYKTEYLSSNHASNRNRPKNPGSKMMLTTQVTTKIGCIILRTSTNYGTIILSANHASNHERTPKSLSEKTYSSILYILQIILFLLTGGDTRTRTCERMTQGVWQKK